MDQVKWFLFGFIVGAAIASVLWKVYIEDHFYVRRD